MKKNGDGTSDGVVSRSARSSLRAFSNCIKVISSGASTVARSAFQLLLPPLGTFESHHAQVLWAGFDKLEKEDGDTRIVLLLAFQSGFQVGMLKIQGMFMLLFLHMMDKHPLCKCYGTQSTREF